MTEFETYLRAQYPSEPSRVQQAEIYSLIAPAKRVRPRLLFATLKGFGVSEKVGYPAACALEMIHTYSLIHDDLPAMDDDDLRRGRNTCHVEFDEATAILAGDALLTRAFLTITKSETSHIGELVEALAQAAGDEGMIQGQMDDMYLESLETCEIEFLQQVHHNKTGQLLQVPLAMASILAERTDATEALREFGFMIGLAFQIQDDILDVTSTKEELGKSNSDAENNKITYVTLLGVEQSKALMLQTYEKALKLIYNIQNFDTTYLEEIVDILKNRKK